MVLWSEAGILEEVGTCWGKWVTVGGWVGVTQTLLSGNRSDIMCTTSATVSCCPNRAVPPRLTAVDRVLYNQIPGRAFFSLAAFVRSCSSDVKAICEGRHNGKWRSQDLQMTAEGAAVTKIYFLCVSMNVCTCSAMEVKRQSWISQVLSTFLLLLLLFV